MFAPVFHLLPISFCLSFSSLVFLSCFRPALLLGFLPCLLFVLFPWLCGLAFGVGWVVGFLSLSDYMDKKKGRKGFAPCVLSCPVMCV